MNNTRLIKHINFKGECKTSISIVRLFDLEIEKNDNMLQAVKACCFTILLYRKKVKAVSLFERHMYCIYV